MSGDMQEAVGLTPRQAAVLAFFGRTWSQLGHSPSYDDVCAEFGFTTRSNAHRLVYLLVQRGYLTSPRGRSRAARLTPEGERWFEVLGSRISDNTTRAGGQGGTSKAAR